MRAILVTLLLFSTVLAGCASTPPDSTPATGGNSTTTGGKAPMVATIELGDSAPQGLPAPGTMTLVAKGMDALMVGMPVNITIKNTGTDTHNVVSPDMGLKSPDVAPGKSVTLMFTPTKAGTFDIYCDKGAPDPSGTGVGSHRSAGMAGKATVKAAA